MLNHQNSVMVTWTYGDLRNLSPAEVDHFSRINFREAEESARSGITYPAVVIQLRIEEEMREKEENAWKDMYGIDL